MPNPGRLADRQKTRAAVESQQQHKLNPNPNHSQRDFHRDKGHRNNFEHHRKRKLYRVNSAAANVALAGQQVSPPKNETFASKLNPEARPFNSNTSAKCDFPNCNNQSGPHFLGKCPVFKSKSVFDRQKWVTAKNLCTICFRKALTHVSQCHLLEVMKKLDRKICGVNGCNIQHNYLLHPDQGKASVNMFTVMEEDVAEEAPASKDEDEDDQSPRARLMRGILQAGRPAQESHESAVDSSEDQGEAVREAETASEDEKNLEPEKEKNSQNQDEEARLEYCSMEAIAERRRNKPKQWTQDGERTTFTTTLLLPILK